MKLDPIIRSDLGRWMKAKGLDDRDVAELLDVSRATVSRLRRLKHRPRWPLAARIHAVTLGKVKADSWLPRSEAAE